MHHEVSEGWNTDQSPFGSVVRFPVKSFESVSESEISSSQSCLMETITPSTPSPTSESSSSLKSQYTFPLSSDDLFAMSEISGFEPADSVNSAESRSHITPSNTMLISADHAPGDTKADTSPSESVSPSSIDPSPSTDSITIVNPLSGSPERSSVRFSDTVAISLVEKLSSSAAFSKDTLTASLRVSETPPGLGNGSTHRIQLPSST